MLNKLIGLLFLAMFCAACEVTPSPDCGKKRQLLAFIDVSVVDSLKQKNKDRFDSVVALLEDKFLNSWESVPVDFEVYPIYYNTAQYAPITSLSMPDRLCNLAGADIDEIRQKFDPYKDCKKFEKKVANDNRNYKSFWPILGHISRSVNGSAATKTIVIIDSDLLEAWRTSENRSGELYFVQPNKSSLNRQYLLDCDAIKAATQQVSSDTTEIGKVISGYKKNIEPVADRITVFILQQENPNVVTNNCGAENLLETYINTLFEKAGIKAVQWVDGEKLKAKLGSM
jgi:hypothetical protein